MSPRFELLARCLGLSVLCLGLSLGCGDGGVTPQPPPPPPAGVVSAEASTLSVDRPTGVLPDGKDVAVVTVTVLSKTGSPLAGRPVTVTVEGEGASVAVAAGATAADGTSHASVVSTVAGVKQVRASVKDTDGAQVALPFTARVEFVAAPSIRKLVFREALPDGVAGVPLSGLEVAIQDASGAVVPDSATEVTLSLGSGGIVFPEGVLKVTTVAGVARFPGVVLKRAGANYHFIASANGFDPAASTFFKVVPGAPVAVGLSTLLETAVAGVAQDLQVTLQDAFSNTVTQYTGTVTLTSTDPAATLPAAHAYTAADAGQYTFKGITFRTAGAQDLKLNDGTQPISFNFRVAVSAGPVAKLVFTQQPVRISTRTTLALVEVQLKDAFGNTAPVGAPSVTLSLPLPQTGFTLSGTKVASPVAGVAKFTALSLAGHGVTHLIASAQGLPDANSGDLEVVDDVPPAKPVLTQTAATETSLTVQWTGVGDDGTQGPLAAQELRYATTPIGSEAAFFEATPVTVGAPVPPGTLQSVTISNLAAGSTYHVALKATDGHGNSTLSDSLAVSTADPTVTQLAFVLQPAGGKAGTALADVRVALQDARGDVVTAATTQVTLTLTGQAGFPAQTVPAVNGVATFKGLRVDTAGTFSFTATAGSLNQKSQPFTVGAGAAAKLLLADFTGPVNAGESLDVAVSLTDAFGNLVLDYAGTVHFTSSDAQAVLPPDATFTPVDQGQKLVTGLVFKTAGTQTLTAVDTADAALTATVDADVRSVAATSFEVIAGAGPFAAGQSVSYELVARDGFGNVAKDYASTVVFTSTDAQAVLPGAFTFTLADEGRHVFSVELRTAGDQDVVATDVVDDALEGTHTYSIVPAAADQLAFVSAPVTGDVRQALGDVVVVLRDAYGNTVTNTPRDVTLDLAGGSFAQGPATQTTVDGVATFTGLVVDAEGTYQFTATVDGLPVATSADLGITDAVAPAIAQDFAATALSASSIRLDWKAAGDDGDLGTATRYELRYSTAAITEANFDSATQVTGVGAPQAPGTAETFTVSGLEVGTTYFFALKTFDGANNGSAIATASGTTTNPCDGFVCTPPAPTCAADARSLVTYSQACVVVAGAPSCEDGPPSSALCPGANGVCFADACTTATGPASGELFLSEVMHSPSAGTTEYLELTNTSAKLLNVTGLSVSYSDGVTTPSSITVAPGAGFALLVAPGEALVLAQDAASQTNGGVSARYAYGTSFVLGNTGALTVKQGATTVDSLTYTNAFPQTTGRAMSLASSILGTAGSARSWYWCDSSGSLSGGDRGTPGQPNDDCGLNVNPPVDYCNIQYPKTFPSGDGVYPANINTNTPYDIFSQFFDFDVTTRNQQGNDFYPRIEAQLGYGTDATNPAGWTWTQAGFNPGYSAPGGSNNDEMKASLSIPTEGTYRYGFRYRSTNAGAPWVYCDQNGVTVPPAGTYGSVLVGKPALTNHVVISEFSGGNGTGTAATDEFIELYNPTNANVDLSNWQVSYKSATGTLWSATVTIPAGKVIRAHGFFLLAGANYSGGATAPADVSYTFDASASTTAGGHVRIQRLVSGTYVDVDKLGWGTGNSPEGTAAPAHPAVGGSLERKAVSTSTSATMSGTDALRGNGQDTDNNSQDFVTRSARQPQCSTSPLEFY